MKKYLILALSLFVYSHLHAGDDRFGNHRTEIMRSSYSANALSMVVLASATQVDTLNVSSLSLVNSAAMYVNRVTFSGLSPTTVTFYDAGAPSANNSTRTVLSYIPQIIPAGGGVTGVGDVNVDIYFSSSILVNKDCATPPCFVTINWDYLTVPSWGGIGK